MAPLAHRLILVMGLLALLGLGGDRLVDRGLEGVGSIALPSRLAPVGQGEAWDDDPARLYFRFAREYGWWASLGSSTAYRQVLTVSLLAPDATAADYDRWPPRFEPLYAKLARERALTLGSARLSVSGGRYAQNALDEPAHVYVYADPARRLQIAWHAIDKEVAPGDAVQIIQRIATSFRLRTDPRGKFTEMRGRGGREQDRVAAAILLARETLAKAGFGAAEPGKPVLVNGVYAEWMDDPEPRFQFVKPLGLLRASGQRLPVPQRPESTNRPRGSVGWRRQVDGDWISDNRDNDYLPLPGIATALARRQTDATTTLYYYATTVRVAVMDENLIAAAPGRFFEELAQVERAWREGRMVDGERIALPEAPMASNQPGCSAGSCYGIDLHTGTPQLDALRQRLAAALQQVLPEVRAGRFDVAEAAVLAVDREIQSAVMLGAMYTALLREAVEHGESGTRPALVAALHERALHWRLSAYPEPHTAYEADDYAAGRAADRAELAGILADTQRKG